MEKEVFHSVSYGVSESEKVKMHIQCSYTFLLQLMDYIPLGFPLVFQDVQLHHFADLPYDTLHFCCYSYPLLPLFMCFFSSHVIIIAYRFWLWLLNSTSLTVVSVTC
jgi:hypothetical protein